MAAEIKPVCQEEVERQSWEGCFKKMELASMIEGFDFNQSLFVGPNCEAIVTTSNDKTIRIFLKKDKKYLQVFRLLMPAIPYSLKLDQLTKKIYVGLNNGTVMEYNISDDLTKLEHVRDVLAHNDRVTCIYLSKDWVFTGSKDKTLSYYDNKTGKKIHSCLHGIWISCIEFDGSSNCIFIGDYSGHIGFFKIGFFFRLTLYSLITGHSAPVKSLAWAPERKWLISGGSDNVIVVWDVGGKKGFSFELNGHQDKVQCLYWIKDSNQLLSSAFDSFVFLWDLKNPRKPLSNWEESDKCQNCGRPFFWNLRTMWESKVLGGRQHHCRKCGKAVCSKCSISSSPLPQWGFELPIHICNPCHQQLSDDDFQSLSIQFQSKHRIKFSDFNRENLKLLTVGNDQIIKVWDLSS